MRRESIYAKCGSTPALAFHWYSARHDVVEDMEILAPATVSTYKTAIHNGADAIYFGYGEFNARAGAENFTSSLEEVVSYCHFFDVKAYLTLNIAMKDTELEEAERIVKEAEKAHIDAFIIADLSLVPIIKRCSTAQIHASTQLGIHNCYGIQFAYLFGFDRVVLSREVTFSELNAIGMGTPVDLEFFIHGALCISFSGACLLSSMLTGNSGNRGRCNQLCRKFYRSYLEGKEVAKGYLLSAKDVCMGEEYLEKIASCCVRSGKIEGRLRRAEYIGGTTSYYHDLKLNNESRLSENDLKALFNRGDFTPGYFKGKGVVYPFSPAHIGITVGKVVKTLNPHTALVKCEEPLKRQNGYKLMRKDREVAGCTATGEQKNNMSVIYCSEVIFPGDCVHLTSDVDLRDKILSERRKMNVALVLTIVGGERPCVEFQRGKIMEKYEFDFVAEKAERHPLTKEEIEEQFLKTTDSDFSLHFLYIHTENAFLAKSQLNAMRRKTLELIAEAVKNAYEPEPTNARPIRFAATNTQISGDFAEIKDVDDVTDKLLELIPNIVYSPEIFDLEGCKEFYRSVKKPDNTVWIKPPVYLSEHVLEKFEKMACVFDGIVCNNVCYVAMARQNDKLCVAGPSLNIFNKTNPLIDVCNGFVLSVELNKYEIKKIPGGLLYTYGYLPLMHLSFCPRNQIGITCDNCYGKIEFKDERGSYLITTTKIGKGYCTHQMRNSVLTDVGNDTGKDMYFDFTVMNEGIDEVLYRYFDEGLYTPMGTNKLHLNRGVR